MTQQQLAYITIASTFLAIFGGIVSPYSYEVSEVSFTLAGGGYVFFSTYLAFKILKK